MTRSSKITAAAIAFANAGAAIQLNTQDASSIKAAAGTVAKGLYAFHNPSASTGQFNQPQPWYWWLSGSGWTGLMDYTVYTGDNTYKADLMSALAQNVGPKFDFSPPSQAGWEANDDLAYWLYNALTAMEYDFDTLPGGPSWDVVATNVFNLYADRWNQDKETCNGGLKWQYNPQASGWTYKNAVSNGAFFQTAARLARYTGKQEFADWASRIWDWTSAVGIVSGDFHVYDGTTDADGANCTQLTKTEWSYNMATFIHGAAHMANFTADATWLSRVEGLVGTASKVFFEPASGVMFEQNCEPKGACTVDQTSFKASLARWLGKTAVIVPSLTGDIMAMLEKSAAGAAQSCVGNGDSTCGISWTGNGYDGLSDFGVELSALEVIQSLLVLDAPAPAVAAGVQPKPAAPAPVASKPAPTSSAVASSTFQTKTKAPASTTQTPTTTAKAAPETTKAAASSVVSKPAEASQPAPAATSEASKPAPVPAAPASSNAAEVSKPAPAATSAPAQAVPVATSAGSYPVASAPAPAPASASASASPRRKCGSKKRAARM